MASVCMNVNTVWQLLLPAQCFLFSPKLCFARRGGAVPLGPANQRRRDTFIRRRRSYGKNRKAPRTPLCISVRGIFMPRRAGLAFEIYGGRRTGDGRRETRDRFPRRGYAPPRNDRETCHYRTTKATSATQALRTQLSGQRSGERRKK